jgi:PAS domain S-box/diguanylate cyclase (GGDEF) domain
MALDEVTIPESVLRRSYAFERFGAPAAVLDASGVIVETNESWRLFAALNEARPGTTGPGVDYLAVCKRAAADGVETAHAVVAGLDSILRGERASFELEYPSPSPIEDRWFLLHASTAPVFDGAGLVLFHVNITARKLLEERLAQEAGHDPLTGLPDRRATIRLIDNQLAHAAVIGAQLTLIHLRLDGLDVVDGNLGRPAGDELLVQVVTRTRRSLRAGDHLCRLDGAQLLVVCPDLDDESCAGIMQRLRHVITAPFQVGSVEASLGCAIGVASSEPASTAPALLAAAELAADTVEGKIDRRAPRPTRSSDVVDHASVGPIARNFEHITSRDWDKDAIQFQRRLLDAAGQAIVAMDTNGDVTYWNAAATTIYGWAAAEALGRPLAGLLPPARGWADVGRVVQARVETGDTWSGDFWVRRKDGVEIPVLVTDTPVFDDTGAQIGTIGVSSDITERKQHELDQARLSAIVADSTDAMISTTLGGFVQSWNRAAEALYGHPAETMIGRDISITVPPDRVDELRNLLGSLRAGVPVSCFETVRRRADDTEIPVSISISPIRDADGEVIGTSAVVRDITDRKRLERDLRHQATHDALTDLPNRTLLLDQLESTLAACEPGAVGVGVLLCNVDRFKLINDSLGHDRGDQLLVAIASALRGTVGSGNIVARFGGDTFAVVTPGLTAPEQALELAGRIQARMADGVLVGAERYTPTFSVGIVIAAPGDAPITALRDADTAMYRAKERGSDRAEWFDPSLHREIVASFEVERELRHAIDHEQLHLVYQPVLDLETNEIRSCEALVRWTHPTRGELGPDEFIPVAESSGLIVPLGTWVLRHALAAITEWPEAIRVSVNLSPRQLAEPDLLALVREALDEFDIPASRLVLEITETAVLQDPTAAARTVSTLRALGVSVVIDDFGTGYTSLSFLRDYRLDGLKIDRSFITDLDHGSTVIVDAIIRMAGALDLAVVAEGVETQSQLDKVRGLGCRYIQGYLVSRPVASADLPFMPASRP